MYFPAGINQGLAAALRAPPSGLFIALVIQVPAGTALDKTSLQIESEITTADCPSRVPVKRVHHKTSALEGTAVKKPA